MVYNVNRRKGAKLMKPDAYICKKEVEEEKQNLDDPKQLHMILKQRLNFKEK